MPVGELVAFKMFVGYKLVVCYIAGQQQHSEPKIVEKIVHLSNEEEIEQAKKNLREVNIVLITFKSLLGSLEQGDST